MFAENGWRLILCCFCRPLQDIRLLNAGKPAQHTAEIERELDKADNMIRLLFNDVQVLKDGRHPQAEQMYRRSVPREPIRVQFTMHTYFN